jgi:malonyl-ACP O-methyltransferase BioC
LPTHRIDKQLVCRRFQQAAASYDHHALIQERTAAHLLDLLLQQGARPYKRVLEIGCGTGLLTRLLLRRISGMDELFLNDLVPDFACRLALECTERAPTVHFLPGDIETLPLPGCFDLIISSSALHWLDDLSGLLTKLAVCLKPGGIIAFSLYGPNNLHEIRELTGLGLPCHSLPELTNLLDSSLSLLHGSEEQAQLHFASPQEVLRHLRQTGVNALSRSPWNRARLEQFCAAYRRRFSAGGRVTLTYHPMYCLSSKACVRKEL